MKLFFWKRHLFLGLVIKKCLLDSWKKCIAWKRNGFAWHHFSSSNNVYDIFLWYLFRPFCDKHHATLQKAEPYIIDCPLLKGNQAPHLKFERPNGKISESKSFLTSVKNWCVQLTWKLNEPISFEDLTRIKTNQNHD